MTEASANINLNASRKAQDDEFYTSLGDIADFVSMFSLEGKTVYCNCDNHETSQFYRYFKICFGSLKLKKLICTGYECEAASYDGKKETFWQLKENGDFGSQECADIAKEADIVVTNPPFSRWRKYWAMMESYKRIHGTDFMAVGHLAAATYSKSLHSLANRIIMPGPYLKGEYLRPDGSIEKLANTLWYSTLSIPARPLDMTEQDLSQFKRYDDVDAIEIPKLKSLPKGYCGKMGVPITYIFYHNPGMFEILGCDSYTLNGVKKFKRFLIRLKKETPEADIQ